MGEGRAPQQRLGTPTPLDSNSCRIPNRRQNPAMGKVTFKIFRGTWASWAQLFQQAAEFANTLRPDQLISISHSADHQDGVVTVWYRRGHAAADD